MSDAEGLGQGRWFGLLNDVITGSGCLSPRCSNQALEYIWANLWQLLIRPLAKVPSASTPARVTLQPLPDLNRSPTVRSQVTPAVGCTPRVRGEGIRVVSTRCSTSPTYRKHPSIAVEIPVSVVVEPMAWVWGCAGRRDRPCNSEGGTQPEKEILGCGGGLVGGGGLVHGSWRGKDLLG